MKLLSVEVRDDKNNSLKVTPFPITETMEVTVTVDGKSTSVYRGKKCKRESIHDILRSKLKPKR